VCQLSGFYQIDEIWKIEKKKNSKERKLELIGN
jgi:hypothetical protein